jgi:hypothetical protein
MSLRWYDGPPAVEVPLWLQVLIVCAMTWALVSGVLPGGR